MIPARSTRGDGSGRGDFGDETTAKRGGCRHCPVHATRRRRQTCVAAMLIVDYYSSTTRSRIAYTYVGTLCECVYVCFTRVCVCRFLVTKELRGEGEGGAWFLTALSRTSTTTETISLALPARAVTSLSSHRITVVAASATSAAVAARWWRRFPPLLLRLYIQLFSQHYRRMRSVIPPLHVRLRRKFATHFTRISYFRRYFFFA